MQDSVGITVQRGDDKIKQHRMELGIVSPELRLRMNRRENNFKEVSGYAQLTRLTSTVRNSDMLARKNNEI